MVLTDANGRLLFCSPAQPASYADITQARQLGLVKHLTGGSAHLPGGRVHSGPPPGRTPPAHDPVRERQESDTSEALDRNAKVIAEFHTDEGRVGGVFEGAPPVLVHHRGRESGQQQVSPARRYPRFAEYARQTVGIRTIPVFELRQA